MKRLALAAAVLVALVAGCHKDNAGTAPSDNSAPTSAGAPSAIAADSEEIPTEADFEDEADQKVTAQNLDDELDKLEKEIGQ